MADQPYIDAHVHFWNPAVLDYPWLERVPQLLRPMLPVDYPEAPGTGGAEKLVFVEGNPRPDQGVEEARMIEGMAADDGRIAGIVALVDLTSRGRDAALDRLAELPRVRGIRHNIQGNPDGFCLQPPYVEGVREVGRRGLTFDLCATHDQLGDVIRLVGLVPDTRFVLDHCGKPAIADGLLDPWREHITALAAHENVWCKVSGLLTEAGGEGRRDEVLWPYVEHVTDRFGTDRLMYGSDWPVVTLAGSASGWLDFTRLFTRGWSAAERGALFHDNAIRFYEL